MPTADSQNSICESAFLFSTLHFSGNFFLVQLFPRIRSRKARFVSFFSGGVKTG